MRSEEGFACGKRTVKARLPPPQRPFLDNENERNLNTTPEIQFNTRGTHDC